MESEDNDITNAPPEDAFETEAAAPPVVTPCTLPPEFYRQHVPYSALPQISPPFVKPPPPTSAEDNTIVHIYVKATISIQTGMPDVAGLMKIHDLLEFQMEKQATIIVLPLKTSRRSGKSHHYKVDHAKNPLTGLPSIFSRVYNSTNPQVLRVIQKTKGGAEKNSQGSPTYLEANQSCPGGTLLHQPKAVPHLYFGALYVHE
jgi:hypothetical protein